MRSGTLPEIANLYAAAPPKGEIVVLIGPPPREEPPDMARIDALLRQALPFMPVKAASALIADATGTSRHAVYERALALKSAGPDEA